MLSKSKSTKRLSTKQTKSTNKPISLYGLMFANIGEVAFSSWWAFNLRK